MHRKISDLLFEYIGTLKLKRDVHGAAIEYTHELKTSVKRNRYAAGTFCDFGLVGSTSATGVYALTVGDEVKYIGECANLRLRFGPCGYGHVSPRNCHSDGQSTNCKINSLVLGVSRAQDQVKAWFLLTPVDRKSIESRLIRELTPSWNGSVPQPSDTVALTSDADPRPVVRANDQFGAALRAELADAERSGQRLLRVRSGDLHRRVGGYPGPSHKMPQCCRAMRTAMSIGDIVIESPPKGAGANLVIEYRLPRQPGSLSR